MKKILIPADHMFTSGRTRNCLPVFVLILLVLSSCQFLLGPDADTTPSGVLHSLWKDFNELHAYIHIRMDINTKFENWNEVYNHYNEKLKAGDIDLFYACSGMLQELADPHVTLYAPGGYFFSLDNSYYTYRNNYSYSAERDDFISIMTSYLTDEGTLTDDEMFLYGTLISAPHIGYLHISGFIASSDLTEPYSWVEAIDKIVKFFRENTSAVIIDIRYNTGGISQAVEYIAARFSATQENYLLSSAKNGPGRNDFSAPLIYRVTPARPAYTKPVVLLTNKVTISAAEWFTLAMRTQAHVTHVGTSTNGALSVRTIRPMTNGWYYTISAQKITDMDDKCYEGFGIHPDIEIIGEAEKNWTIHPGLQLEAVLEWMDTGLNKGNTNE